MPDFIGEPDIGSITFTEADGLFLFIGPQVDYIRSIAGPSIENATFFSMSLHALAEILKRDHARTVTHDDFVSDAEMRTIRQAASLLDRTWLGSMGCRFGVEGIDFAEIDALCQYTFFRYVLYIDLIGRRMIEAHPEISRFFIIRGPEPLPLDFDFDSELGQAVIRHLCEQLGRPVIDLVSLDHAVSNGPDFRRRPYSKGWVTPMMMGVPEPEAPVHHIGIIPSTVPCALRIVRDATTLNCAQILFHSPWPVSAPRVTSDEQEEARLTPADKAWAATMAEQLAALRVVIGQRLERSNLPPAIAGNPHLGFQFDHIITRRWLMLAAMARAAARFARTHPLEIFINPEMANWEGMILAHFYRRQGSKILVAPHSGWPGPAFDASWRPGDWAMVYSRMGNQRLRAISGLDKVYTIGMPWVSLSRAPGWESILAEKRRILGDKKLVVHVANPSEVSFLPSFDQKAHFAMVAAFGKVPAHLSDQVRIALRRRSPRGCEDNTVYRRMAGLDDEVLDFLDGLSFTDCVELADCLVGINAPTSGFYEVFQGRKPLIHLQGMAILWMQPDLPGDVLGRIDHVEQLWPAIERVLFDDAHRNALLNLQARFLQLDLKPDFDLDESPIRSLLNVMLTQD